VVVTGRLTIPTAGDLLQYSAVASEALDSVSRHLLLRLLRLCVSGEQQRWRGWVWICGVDPMTTKIIIQYQNQFGRWHRFQEKHNAADAYRTAKKRARSTGKRHRLVFDVI